MLPYYIDIVVDSEPAQILRAILPSESDSVTAFTAVGHILHLNLKDDVIEYADIIG